MDGILHYVSDYAVGLRYEALPASVIHQVKRCLVDAVGCALGAGDAEPVRIASDYALTVSADPGATVLGTRYRTSAELAAFANGVMVRYLDYNDTGSGGDAGHPSDSIAAVLAAAEVAAADLRTLVCAVVIAYEVHGRFAAAGLLKARGWDPVTWIALASAAGSAKALGLPGECMANALALTITSNIAMRQIRHGALSMWKGAASGYAAGSGLFAAILASRGMTGPHQAFEGKFGLQDLVTGAFELDAFGGDGRSYKIEDAKFKVFPADYECQCAVHPALELRAALDGKTDSIERVIVDTYHSAVLIAADSADKWHPATRETADHSLPFILAVVLLRGGLWLDDFSEENIKNFEIQKLMQKIEVRENPEFTRAYPEANCFRIELITRSGQRHVREIRYAKGHPKDPLSDAEIAAKFRRLAAPVMAQVQIDSVLERLWHLEEAGSVRELMDALATH